LDFGIENRALQHLVLSVLYAIAELHPRQFATRGGVPAAIAQVMKAMKAGYIHAREIDIKDFYPSFDRNKLVESVPVQKRVIERVLLSDHLNIIPPSKPHHILSCFGAADKAQGEVAPLEKYLAEARRGIPQGSAASPLLAEMLLAPLLFQVPAGGKVVVVAYADNILVLAKTASDADAMTDSLELALKKHPAGPFSPKIKSFSVGGPIEFLGHRVTAHGDKVRAQPTPENQEKFEHRMKRGLARLRKPTLAPATRGRLARDLKSDLSSYVSNFKLCDGVKECQQHWDEQISSAKHKGTTMPQSKPASDNKNRMVFWPHPDQEEIITAALDLAKERVSTVHQTVALEAIAQAYMATGIVFTDWRLALAWDRKATQDAASFAQEVSTFLEKLCPELVIETTIKQRK
jgi:Reverse transcriptase (RNA-dependent DNA polymerase)